jgi:internalin A
MAGKSGSVLVSPAGLELLRAAKARLGLSFAAIGKRAGVSAGTVQKLFHPEQGKRVGRASTIKISTVLNLEVEQITSSKPHREAEDAFSEAQARIQAALAGGDTILDLSGLGLREVPHSIGNLINLRSLDLSRNKITSVPIEIERLTSLRKLNLSSNQIEDVSDKLSYLVNLKELSLSQNELRLVPKWIDKLSNLEILDLFYNKLKTLPKEIGNLSLLRQVYLNNNRLDSIPEDLSLPPNLKLLSLSHNRLKLIPKGFGKAKNLEELFANNNQIESIPEDLGQIRTLTLLVLYQNRLTHIPEALSNLVNLKALYLSENELESLPEKLLEIESIKVIYLHGNNRLGIPREILGPTWQEVREGAVPVNPQDILDYHFKVLTDRTPLNEAKLILVGFGAAGKTSLVNRLIHDTFDPKSAKTEGIQITKWPLRLNDAEDITLHVWDFGGQEIMHSTHQFFLTERSLYLLVLNGRQGHEDEDADYWLELIQSFGGGSPVIVVLNKIHEHPFDVNRGALQQKFPNIRNFIATDCATETGLAELRAAIEQETDALEHLRDPFPKSWVAIKDRLAQMADNYISFEQYRQFCQHDGED